MLTKVDMSIGVLYFLTLHAHTMQFFYDPKHTWLAQCASSKLCKFIQLGPRRPSVGGPRMDRWVVTSPEAVKVSRLTSQTNELQWTIAHISHYRHYLRWCTFFKPAYFFPQRTRKGMLLAKFIQRISKHLKGHLAPRVSDVTFLDQRVIPGSL